MSSKKQPQFDDLIQTIGELAVNRDQLARQACRQFAPEVEAILGEKCCDPQRIERLLDEMLDFCFDDTILRSYKKLCRYYFAINPEAIAYYVKAYREMWDK